MTVRITWRIVWNPETNVETVLWAFVVIDSADVMEG